MNVGTQTPDHDKARTIAQGAAFEDSKISEISNAIRNNRIESEEFRKAIKDLERTALFSPDRAKSRESLIEVDPQVERKIIAWLDSGIDLSREHSSHESLKQSRNLIAFKAWLLWSPEWKLFTQENGEYAFSVFIRDLLSNWETMDPDEREVALLKVRKVFQFVINFIETKLPNPFAWKEAESIYRVSCELAELIEGNYHQSGLNDSAIRGISRIRNAFINNYEALFAEKHDTELLSRIQGAHSYLENAIKFASDISPEKQREQILQHAMTFEFRRSIYILRSGDFTAEEQKAALENMCRTSHVLISRRVFWDSAALAEHLESQGLSHAEAFPRYMLGYNPHTIPSVDLHAANQAELDAIANTLESFPNEHFPLNSVREMLKNFLGNADHRIKYHDMDNCQGYILRIVEELYKRLESFEDDALIGLIDVLDWTSDYLQGLPHHPMHVDLVWLINLRLANIESRIERLQELPPEKLGNITKERAEKRFVKGLRLLNTSGNTERATTALQVGKTFLERHHENCIWTSNGVRWDAEIGLKLVKLGAEYARYEYQILQDADERIESIVSELEGKGGRSHANTLQFLQRAAKAISQCYGWAFEVRIGEKSQFQRKFGDFKRSEEIPLGFGYYAFIEYPTESQQMVEKGLSIEKEGVLKNGKLDKFLSRDLANYLWHFIWWSSNPELFTEILKYSERYAQYQRLLPTEIPTDSEGKKQFDAWEPGDLQVDIVHQKKFLADRPIGAEMLSRFKDRRTWQRLPLNEVFLYCDLFWTYKCLSRVILKKALPLWAMLWPLNVCTNVRWDEFADEDYHAFIRDIANGHDISADLLTLEILESDDLDLENEITRQSLISLKELGFHIAMDDFGATKYSFDDRFVQLRKLKYIDRVTGQECSALGVGDELKFDAVYKEHLKAIAEFTADWDETTINLENIIASWESTLSETALSMLRIIRRCQENKIKCTIEQLEKEDISLIRIAVQLGLMVQGFCYHEPEPVPMTLPNWVVRLSDAISEKASKVLVEWGGLVGKWAV